MQSSERSVGGRVGLVALWVITVLDAALMALAGSAKFTAAAWWSQAFVTFGYPAWFSYATGAAEVVLAVLLLIPRIAAYAAAGLIVIMLGALVSTLLHPGRLGPVPPLMHIVVLSVILLARWKVRWRPS